MGSRWGGDRPRPLGVTLPPDDRAAALEHRLRELRRVAERVLEAWDDVETARYNNEARRASYRVGEAIHALSIELGRNVDRRAVRDAVGGRR